jgi:hypothetical protein
MGASDEDREPLAEQEEYKVQHLSISWSVE